MLYPCAACGFKVFEDAVGSYDICPICDWEDDGVQLRFPLMQGGANGDCFYEWQQKIINNFPVEVAEINGFLRDKTWRPISFEECQNTIEIPKTGFDYFQAIDLDIPTYYWKK